MKATIRSIILAAIVISVICVSACDVKVSPNEKKLSCTLTVDCTRVYGELDPAIIPSGSDGYFLKNKKTAFSDGDSAIEVLTDALSDEKLTFDISDGYVKEIAGVNAGDFGGTSGWLYSINGEMPDVGADEYRLSDGDSIEFVYYDDYGKAFAEAE